MNPKITSASFDPDLGGEFEDYADEFYEDEIIRDVNDDLVEEPAPKIISEDDNVVSSEIPDNEDQATAAAENDDQNLSSESEETAAKEEPEEAAPTQIIEETAEPMPVSSANQESAPLADEAPIVVAQDSDQLDPPSNPQSDDESPIVTLWAKGYSQFIIAKHLGLSTKFVRDEIEKLGLTEKPGALSLPDDHAYWTAALPEKRNIERQLLSEETDVPPAVASAADGKPKLPASSAAGSDVPIDEQAVTSLWDKGYSQFIIAKHLGLSTKLIRDKIEQLGLSEKQGKLDLPESHEYWNATLPQKRDIERLLLSNAEA